MVPGSAYEIIPPVQVWVEANMQVRAVEIISLTHYHCPQHSHHNYQTENKINLVQKYLLKYFYSS